MDAEPTRRSLPSRGARLVSWLAVAVLAIGLSSGVRAQSMASQLKQRAGDSFRRGVALYNEGDFEAALIEFQRAYKSAPNPHVLYNIGQTFYQLQRYADALRTLDRYLADVGSSGRYLSEAKATVKLLQSRVGWVRIKSNVTGAQVAIDDVDVGSVPLGEPIMVGVGRRKVTGTIAGRPSVTRYAEISAGERVVVNLMFSEADSAAARAGSAVAVGRDSGSDTSAPGAGRRVAAISLWAAGGAFGIGSIVTGIMALKASRDLESDRERFGATREELDDSKSKAKGLAIATDVLLAATAVSAGLALFLTLTAPDDERSEASSTKIELGLSPAAVQLRVGF